MKLPFTNKHVYAGNPDGDRKLAEALREASPSVRMQLAEKAPKQVLPGVYAGPKSQVRTLKALQQNYAEQRVDALDHWAAANGARSEDRKQARSLIDDWQRVQYAPTPLRLSGLSLTSVPPLPHRVQTLDLSNNRLMELPQTIAECEKIEELRLGKNNIASLPVALCSLRQLKALDLADNPIAALPKEIGALSQLEKLGLDNTDVATFPESFTQLRSLRKLSCWDTKLSALPSTWGNLQDLSEFQVSSKQLQHLPESLWDLKNLTCLTLFLGEGAQLSSRVGQLTGLESLTFSGAKITEVPAEIGMLHRMKELNLSGNALSELPKELAYCSNLHYINLSNNNFTKIPRSLLTLRRVEIPSNYENNQVDGYMGDSGPTYYDSVVNLRGNPIPPEEIAAFQRELAANSYFAPRFVFSDKLASENTPSASEHVSKYADAKPVNRLTPLQAKQEWQTINDEKSAQKELWSQNADSFSASLEHLQESGKREDLEQLLRALDATIEDEDDYIATEKRQTQLENYLEDHDLVVKK